MNSLETPQPRIVSLEELQRVLRRYTKGYKWAESAIYDLWKMGAPFPNIQNPKIERRLLLPSQFSKWWEDVAKKMGYSENPSDIYRGI